MTASRIVPTVFRRATRNVRAIMLALALVTGGASAGLYAPTIFGQTVPGMAQATLAAPAQPLPSPAAQAGLLSCADRAEPAGTKPYIRSELFFGTSKPDGTEVTPAEFNRFVDQEITPRFPDGLTLLTGYGQYRNSQGVITQETSKLLILLYPVQDRLGSSVKLELIRAAYKRQFQQESVLRSDDPLPSCVSF